MDTATTKPEILDGDTVRPMTNAEHEQHLTDLADGEARATEQAARETARTSAIAKLAALGLTDAEIAALVGA